MQDREDVMVWLISASAQGPCTLQGPELVSSPPQKAVVDAAVAFLDLGMVQPIAHVAEH